MAVFTQAICVALFYIIFIYLCAIMTVKEYTDYSARGIDIMEKHLHEASSNETDFIYISSKCLTLSKVDLGKGLYVTERDLRKFYQGDKVFLEKDDLLICVLNKEHVFIHVIEDLEEGRYLFSRDIRIIRPYSNYFKNIIKTNWWRSYIIDKIHNQLDYLPNTSIAEIDKLVDSIEIPTTAQIEDIELATKGDRPDKRSVDVSLIDVKTQPMSIDKILKRINAGEINIETPFQRQSGLWDNGTKSRLIEAMIVDLRLPAFYFDTSDDDKWQIIDGLQRLTAINEFINDQYKLDDLYYLGSAIEGKIFSKLERRYQRAIEEYDIIAYLVGKRTPKEVKYKLFRSINEGGLKLVKQEIRHALNQGKPSELLTEVCEKHHFLEYVNVGKEKERMLDREMALRYFAFRMTNYREYKPDMPDFLDEAMTKIYVQEYEKLERWKSDLDHTLFILGSVFGKNDLFTRNMLDKESTTKYPFNAVLFETFTYAVSVLGFEKRQNLIGKEKKLREMVLKLSENKAFGNAISNESANTKESLIYRFQHLEQLFQKL